MTGAGRATCAWIDLRWPIAVAIVLMLSACGSDREPRRTADVPVDSALVDVLADLHLVDARMSIEADSASARTLRDSARALVLSTHQLTEEDLRRHLRALADDPAVGSATYLALETRLSMERQGATP